MPLVIGVLANASHNLGLCFNTRFVGLHALVFSPRTFVECLMELRYQLFVTQLFRDVISKYLVLEMVSHLGHLVKLSKTLFG